jgi:Spy/CpxP family protein refolding chaperone
MGASSAFPASVILSTSRSVPTRAFLALAAALVLAASLPAQDAAVQAPAGANAGSQDSPATRTRRSGYSQEDMLASLRKRMAVTDDAEWGLISARITAVLELRRSAGGGFGAGFGGRGGGGGSDDSARPARASTPELDALRTAVTNDLTDAEIKARLARLRDARKQNEAKLDKARADLQAVLTVRQEAVAVLAGLLQ